MHKEGLFKSWYLTVWRDLLYLKRVSWIKQIIQILKHKSFPTHYPSVHIYINLLWTISGIRPLLIHAKEWKNYQTAALVSQRFDLEGCNGVCYSQVILPENSRLLEEVVHPGNWLWQFQVGDLEVHSDECNPSVMTNLLRTLQIHFDV